jgi:REP element-mobilizing transposase RayT
MPKPRSSQVSLEATPYYHCISRCVRRAFLCGTDHTTGQDFEHRRQWIEEKLLALGQIFALDVCAYAVMSNHYHVVLYIDQDKAENWSMGEVISQWHQLFSGNLLSLRYSRGELLGPSEHKVLKECTETWRERLRDISWFMRVLNEHIAREANAEDNCTGRFWEGRFKSQALLDEAALAACMAYVDLNPIRAAMASTPEQSDYTSIKQRIQQAQQTDTPNAIRQQFKALMPFVGDPRKDLPKGLPFKLTDYLELLDWTGRIIREDKRGSIPNDIPPVLQRLNIEPQHWLYLSRKFESPFKGLVGSVYRLKQACELLGYQRMPGLNSCALFFP